MDKKAHIVVDLGYGDAGKGTITDYIARQRPVHTVIRFNGGGQAGHNVVTPHGRHHTFSHFGSASFVPRVVTYLSRFMRVSPGAMLVEAERLASNGVEDIFERTFVSEDALIVTSFHRAANRLREIVRGSGRHGSVGLGIGEAGKDELQHPGLAIRAKDLTHPPDLLLKQLIAAQAVKREELRDVLAAARELTAARDSLPWLEQSKYVHLELEQLERFRRRVQIVDDSVLQQRLMDPGDVVFEGAQGVLLDEDYGFFPYVTRSHCTFKNALALLEEHRYSDSICKLGVTRAYMVRHGPGPFVSEAAWLGDQRREAHNKLDAWQLAFRYGWFDAVAMRYAIEVCEGIDALAITCLDRLSSTFSEHICDAYELRSSKPGTPTKPLTKIPHIDPQDFVAREALSRQLLEARPHTRVMRDPVTDISDTLQTPVWITSQGPTANDKKWL